ncbi:peptidylprolyl isomerase [Diaphorobacter sp.]|uniref:peptidylprolyl isomerase n=1 Tax=Diaphorobacter sp. TaxID=1934310 RepID=UPI0028A9DE63|nr:peptidylprolyl isomerase [Diaphorobacter sp.]
MNMYRQMGLVAAGLCLTASVFAAQPVVLLESGNVKVTDADVRAELSGAPAGVADRTLANPEALTRLAKAIASRRMLVQQAQQSGLANKPEIKTQLRINEERLLSEARMEQFDNEHKPDAKAIDDYARSAYKSNPKAFEVPADTHVRHILVEGDTSEAKAKADKLVAELKAGADFEKLAKEQSDDKGSAENGGDLGFAPAGRFVPEFEKAMKGLTKKGEISAPVKTQFGWHVIQFVERRPARVLPYEEVAERMRGEATKRLLNRKRLEYSNELIKDAKLHEDAIKSVAATAAQPAKK